MKKLFQLSLIVLFFTVALIGIQSCKDDDPIPTVMLVSERSTGKLFTVDIATAAKTEVGQIKNADGNGVSNIRGLIYSKAANKLFSSGTSDGGGSFYSIEPKTWVATVINANEDNHVFGVADLLMTAENRIIGTLWFQDDSNVGYGPGLLIVNANGTGYDSILFSDDNICCGMGMVYGSNNNELFIASDDIEIYKSDLQGNITFHTALTPDGFDTIDPDHYAIQNMVKNSTGKIYATVYSSNNGNTYLGQVDIANEKLIKIGQLNADGTTERYHGLILLPQNLL